MTRAAGLSDSSMANLRQFGSRSGPAPPIFAVLQSMGAQGVIMVLNVLTGIVTARMLGPDGRGVYAALTLWPPFLAMLSVAGLNRAIVVRMRKAPEAIGAVAGAAAMLGFLQSLVAVVLGATLLPAFMSNYPPAIVAFAQVCLLGVVFNAAQNVVKQTFAGTGHFGCCSLMHLLPQLFHFLALLALIALVDLTPSIAAVALFGASAAAVVVMLPAFVRIAKPRLQGVVAEVRRLSSFAARAALTDVVFTIVMYADRLILLPLLSAAELGIYAVAFSFSRLIQFVQPAITSVVLSCMSGHDEADGKRLHDEISRVLLASLVIGCGLLWLAGESLLALAYGDQFRAANWIFRFLVIEAAFGVLSQVSVQLFQSRERPGIVSIIQVATLCLTLAAIFALVPHYGAVGAAVAMAAAGTVRWLLLLGAMKVALKLPLPRLYLTRDDLRNMMRRLRPVS